jgi:hypothetical protein
MRMSWSCLSRENMLRLLGTACRRLWQDWWLGMGIWFFHYLQTSQKWWVFQETWRLHTKYIQRRCRASVNFMKSISGESWRTHPACLLVLYKSTVRFVIEYGGMCFSGMSDCHMRRLKRIQWRAGRICFGVMRSPSDKAKAFDFKGEGPVFGFG